MEHLSKLETLGGSLKLRRVEHEKIRNIYIEKKAKFLKGVKYPSRKEIIDRRLQFSCEKVSGGIMRWISGASNNVCWIVNTTGKQLHYIIWNGTTIEYRNVTENFYKNTRFESGLTEESISKLEDIIDNRCVEYLSRIISAKKIQRMLRDYKNSRIVATKNSEDSKGQFAYSNCARNTTHKELQSGSANEPMTLTLKLETQEYKRKENFLDC